MNTYQLFVGSTDTFDAHGMVPLRAVGAAQTHGAVTTTPVYGEWEGMRENVAILTVTLPSDAIAERIAFLATVETGNDCVLVVRYVSPDDDSPMHSRRAYRVREEWAGTGNRTLYGDSGRGTRFVPDQFGEFVAFLVNADATIGKVS